MSINTFFAFLLAKDIPGVNSHKQYKQWLAEGEKKLKLTAAERLLEGTGHRVVAEDQVDKK